VKINTASREFLLACPGIGPVLADSILEERASGRFRSWDDLHERVSGIGPGKIEVMKKAGVDLDP
jgi:competence protein ComEA